jgi:hypothetical protein
MEATALSSKTEVHAERFEDEQLNLSRNQYGPKEIAWSVVVYWATDDGETRRETSQTVATGLTSKESWVLMQAINAVKERWIGATRQPLRCGCELADKGVHVVGCGEVSDDLQRHERDEFYTRQEQGLE